MDLSEIPNDKLPKPPADYFMNPTGGVAVTQASTPAAPYTSQPAPGGRPTPMVRQPRGAKPLPQQPVPQTPPVSVTNMKEEIFALPSCGLAYQHTDMTLIGGDSVKIRPMLVGDQRRAGSAGNDPYAIYQKLLSKTVTEPNMNVFLDEMLLSDATAILWAVRSLTWGPMYRMDFPCPGCKAMRNQEMDTGMLQVRYASDIENYAAEGIEIDLGAEVCTIHLPTMWDQKSLTANVSRLNKARLLDDPELDRPFVLIASYIDTINGHEATIEQKFQFVDNLYQQDFDKITAKITELDSGIMPTQTIKCQRCQTEVEVALTITPEFFRPTGNRD